jgi:hypothetical protein
MASLIDIKILIKWEKYINVESFLIRNRHIVETETNWMPLTHIYMTAHLPVLVQTQLFII